MIIFRLNENGLCARARPLKLAISFVHRNKTKKTIRSHWVHLIQFHRITHSICELELIHKEEEAQREWETNKNRFHIITDMSCFSFSTFIVLNMALVHLFDRSTENGLCYNSEKKRLESQLLHNTHAHMTHHHFMAVGSNSTSCVVVG